MSESLKLRKESFNNDTSLDGIIYHETKTQSAHYHETLSHLRTVDRGACTGYDTPNYHARVRTGELIPMTPWTQAYVSGSSSGSFDVKASGDGDCSASWGRYYLHSGHWSPSGMWVISYEEINDLLAEYSQEVQYVQAAAAKIYSSGHDTLTFLAELADVRRLFTGALKKLLKLDLPSNWRSMSSEWLSYRYGWRALLYDIENINEAISNLGDTRTRYSQKAGGKYSYHDVDAIEDTIIDPAAYLVSKSTQDSVEISVRGSVVADIVVPKFQFNPLQTGWEIIPFSFVIDWFVSVGTALSALSFVSLSTEYTAAIGLQFDWERVFELDFIDTPTALCCSGTLTQSATCNATVTKRLPTRVPLTPRLRLRLDELKVIDLLALLVQRYRR